MNRRESETSHSNLLGFQVRHRREYWFFFFILVLIFLFCFYQVSCLLRWRQKDCWCWRNCGEFFGRYSLWWRWWHRWWYLHYQFWWRSVTCWYRAFWFRASRVWLVMDSRNICLDTISRARWRIFLSFQSSDPLPLYVCMNMIIVIII